MGWWTNHQWKTWFCLKKGAFLGASWELHWFGKIKSPYPWKENQGSTERMGSRLVKYVRITPDFFYKPLKKCTCERGRTQLQSGAFWTSFLTPYESWDDSPSTPQVLKQARFSSYPSGWSYVGCGTVACFFVKKKRTVWDLGLRRQNLEHADGAGREMSEDLQSLSETNEVVGKLENLWLVVSNIFYSHPYLGKWSNLTNIFQMGWNHQLVLFWEVGWDSPIYTLVFQSYLLRFGVWSVCFWGS